MLKAGHMASSKAPGEVWRPGKLGARAGGTGFTEEADLNRGLGRKELLN